MFGMFQSEITIWQFAAAQHLERFDAVVGRLDLVAGGSQRVAEQFQRDRIVVDRENPHGSFPVVSEGCALSLSRELCGSEVVHLLRHCGERFASSLDWHVGTRLARSRNANVAAHCAVPCRAGRGWIAVARLAASRSNSAAASHSGKADTSPADPFSAWAALASASMIARPRRHRRSCPMLRQAVGEHSQHSCRKIHVAQTSLQQRINLNGWTVGCFD